MVAHFHVLGIFTSCWILPFIYIKKFDQTSNTVFIFRKKGNTALKE